jgi:hypothetical protein
MSPCGRIGPIIFGSEKEKKLRDRDRKSGCSKGLSEVNAEYKNGGEPVEQQNLWRGNLCIMMNLPHASRALNSAVECHLHTESISTKSES